MWDDEGMALGTQGPEEDDEGMALGTQGPEEFRVNKYLSLCIINKSNGIFMNLL